MNYNLAPILIKKHGEHWILWYQSSNSYTVIDKAFKVTLNAFFEAKTSNEFQDSLENTMSATDKEIITSHIENYLKSCNQKTPEIPTTQANFKTNKARIKNDYTINKHRLQVCYSSQKLKNIIHPSISHLETETTATVKAKIDIYLANGELHLFKDEELIIKVPQHQYHRIQGKFVMLMLCTFYNNTEADWIATLHGSTISNNDAAILLMGESGKGKSTLTTLLATHGFQLVADDVSPLNADTTNIHHNPAAVSIKHGAFKRIKPFVPNFKNLATSNYNPEKGEIKYVPFPTPKQHNYPCCAIVMVNYKKDADTVVEAVAIDKVLQTLIPDSWISPNPIHAEQFLNWLKSLNLYQLTYSNTNSGIAAITDIFKSNS
ncbi:hypothetical protein [Lacinutrix undariae]